MPFSRGMEADIYVKLAGGATADSLREALAKQYANEPFVSILPKVLNEAWRAADCSCRSLPTTLRQSRRVRVRVVALQDDSSMYVAARVVVRGWVRVKHRDVTR